MNSKHLICFQDKLRGNLPFYTLYIMNKNIKELDTNTNLFI